MSVPDISSNPLGYLGTNQYTNPITLPVADRAPGSTDIYPINTVWPYNNAGSIVLYVSLGGGNWQVGDNPYATSSTPGVVQLSTNAETVTGSNTTHAVTPANLTARLAAPGAIGGTTPAAGTFTSVTATTGNLTLSAAGSKLAIHATTAASDSVGTSAAMTAGSVTVSTTAVTASSKIFLSRATTGGTTGNLSIGTITAGTSFVINSSSGTDTSTVNYLIIN